MTYPSLKDLEQRAAFARMIIGVIQAATGHHDLHETDLENIVEYGGLSGVAWTEARPDHRIRVEISCQIPDLLGGSWSLDGPVPGEVALSFAKIEFRYEDEVPSGCWRVEVLDKCERPPKLTKELGDLEMTPDLRYISTGMLIGLILEYIAWRDA